MCWQLATAAFCLTPTWRVQRNYSHLRPTYLILFFVVFYVNQPGPGRTTKKMQFFFAMKTSRHNFELFIIFQWQIDRNPSGTGADDRGFLKHMCDWSPQLTHVFHGVSAPGALGATPAFPLPAGVKPWEFIMTKCSSFQKKQLPTWYAIVKQVLYSKYSINNFYQT